MLSFNMESANKNSLADIVGTGFIPVRRSCRISVEPIYVLKIPFIRIKIRRRVDTMWGGRPKFKFLS